MAPEAFEGQADARGDVYALGLTLYELLALRPAFDETDRHRLIEQVTTTEPPRLGPAQPDASRATWRRSSTRRSTATRRTATPRPRELADDLRRFLDDEPILARRASPAERFLAGAGATRPWRPCSRPSRSSWSAWPPSR